jgi:thymidylate kinase
MASEGEHRHVIVVILGTDGCGKSSVVERLETTLLRDFSQVRVLHLRPRLGRGGARQGNPVSDPHRLPPRGLLASLAKLLFLLVDYSSIYPWSWRQRTGLAPPGLIIFDRYYHDLLVDPRRYRYGAPLWIARLFGHLVPSPDLWILLDAPPDVIRKRKQELSLEELVRQSRSYRAFFDQRRNAHVVDATKPLDAVTRTVQDLILARAP